MKRVNFHLTDLQITNLKLFSKKTGMPMAELLRRAIDEWVVLFLRRDVKKGKKI